MYVRCAHVCMCVCVCICVHVSVCFCVCVQSTHVLDCVYVYVCLSVCVYVYMYVCVCMQGVARNFRKRRQIIIKNDSCMRSKFVSWKP